VLTRNTAEQWFKQDNLKTLLKLDLILIPNASQQNPLQTEELVSMGVFVSFLISVNISNEI
jgi:hypothetical protein